MTERIDRHGLRVAKELDDFITGEALPGTGIGAETFWSGFSAIVRDRQA